MCVCVEWVADFVACLYSLSVDISKRRMSG